MVLIFTFVFLWHLVDICWIDDKQSHLKRVLRTWEWQISDFWATVCKTVRPMLSDSCLSYPCCLSCLWRWCIVAKRLDGSRWNLACRWPRPWPHCVRLGPRFPSPKGAQPPPIFGPCLLCPNGWMDQDATWYGGRPRPGHIVLDGDPATSPPKRGHSPQFSALVCCGQTSGWIKMALGTMVGLISGNIVLDADPSPPPRGTAPKFRPMSVVVKWLDGSRCHLVRR